jgi:prepilin-type N-terminal cleavage/methylation domain-containing protein
MRKNTSNKVSPPEAVVAASRHSEAGFSLLEMTVAMLILLIGLLGVEAVIGSALLATNAGRNVTNTKLLVVSILEQMETLRNTRQLTYGQIANQGEVDNVGATQPFNGFLTGFQPVSLNPGPDGMHGTGDDLVAAGADGYYGTTDDVTDPALARTGFTREILITPLSANLKQVTVTLRYPTDNGRTRTQLGISYLNNDARSNFLR